MKKLSLIILAFLLFFANPTMSDTKDSYTLTNTKTYEKDMTPFDKGAKILFIVDFSNSMNEKIEGVTKLQMAINTIESILPKIPSATQIGLRVYGHRQGITYVDGCTATKLAVPLGTNNAVAIQGALYSTSARGWTPITYSLKQAVLHDFAGVEGEKRIILITDGGENCDESPCTYAIGLMRTRDDIKIDVIALDIYDAEANSQLKCTAITTSGKFYSANNSKELKESLQESLNVDKDVKGTIKIK